MAVAPYVPARHQQPRRAEIRLVVCHCTISPEMGTGAESVARYFQTVDRPASAHLVADNNSVVRCVPDNMEACGAAGANRDGLHLELVGYADQSAEQWMDAYGKAMFAQARPFMRDWSVLYNIPPRWLTVAQVADGRSRGFCTHADVSKAFPAVSTGHTDPGKQFPKQAVMDLWFPPKPTHVEEDSMLFIRTSTPVHRLLFVGGEWFMSTDGGIGKKDGSDCVPLDESAWAGITERHKPTKV